MTVSAPIYMELVPLDNLPYNYHIILQENPTNSSVAHTTSHTDGRTDVVSTYSVPCCDVLKNASKDLTMGSGVTRDLQQTNSSLRDSSYVQVRQDRVETTDGKLVWHDRSTAAKGNVSVCSKLMTILNCPNYYVIAAWTMVNKLQEHYTALCMSCVASDVQLLHLRRTIHRSACKRDDSLLPCAAQSTA